MKIAIMAPLVTAVREPQRGGSQAFVSDLARGLVGRGHDVHVYAATGSQIPGVEVIDTGIDPRSLAGTLDRKSTRLNSSHQIISYAVFCLKKKKTSNSADIVSSRAQRPWTG